MKSIEIRNKGWAHFPITVYLMMKFSEGKSLFEAAWTQTSSWSARTHDALFRSMSSLSQDSRLVAFRTECIASGAKLWEIHTFANKYFGILSSEKKLTVIVEGQTQHHLSMHVDDQVTAVAVDLRGSVFHLFIGQHRGKVIHTTLTPSGHELVLGPVTFDLPVAQGAVQCVVPQSYHVHSPLQFWTVTSAAITLHQHEHPYVKSMVEYPVPSGELLNVEHHAPLLAVHFVSRDNSVSSILLHTLASAFYAERSTQHPLRVRTAPGVTTTFGGAKGSFAMIHNLTPDVCLPWGKSNVDVLSQVHFSFELFVLGEGGVDYAVFQTKEFAIRDKLISLGANALISSEWIESSEEQLVDTFELHRFKKLRSDQDQLDLRRQGKTPLWGAILEHRFFCASRETEVMTTQNDQSIDLVHKVRKTVLEALVALQLPHIISEAILLRRNDPLNPTYLIADIQKLFEWVTDDGKGLLAHGEGALENILEGEFHEFAKEGPSSKKKASVAVQLQEVLSISHCIRVISKAFVDRKASSMPADLFLRTAPLKKDMIVQSFVELVLLHERALVFEKQAALLVLLVAEVHLSFQGFLVRVGGDHDISRHQTVSLELPANMVNMLPSYLVSNNLLYHALVHNMRSYHLGAALFDLCEFRHARWLTANVDSLKKLLLLPWRVVKEIGHNIVKDSTYVGKTLDESLMTLREGWLGAVRVLAYALIESDFLSQTSNPPELFADLSLDQMSACLDLPREELYFLRALHAIDSSVHVEAAVEKFVLATGLQYLEDNQLLEAVIQRLFCTDQSTCAWKFMESLYNRDHNILSTKLGAVSVAIAQPVEDQIPLKWKRAEDVVSWEAIWQSARRYCAKVRPFHDSLIASQDAVKFMCKWTIKQKKMSSFLALDFELSELEAVIAFIKERADIEIAHRVIPSPAVDTLIFFLLKHHRHAEAVKIHEAHLSAIQGSQQTADVRDILKDRASLLAVHAKIPSPPSVDYRMQLNLARIRCIKSTF